MRRRGKEEFFHLASYCEPSVTRQEKDLFEGVNEEADGRTD
jgi:hypothetical protein